MMAHRNSGLKWGYSDAPSGWRALPEGVDASLVARKGLLLIVGDGSVDKGLVERIYEEYYATSSFDVLPALLGILGERLAPVSNNDALLVALVILGLQVFVVGTRNAAVWVAGHTEARQVFPAARTVHLPAPPDPDDERFGAATELAIGQWHLAYGDTVVAGLGRALRALGARRIWRVAQAASAADHKARSLARASRDDGPSPVLVVQIPGFSPVPDLGPIRGWPSPRPERARTRQGSGSTPIRAAAVMAIVAVALALWVRRPDLSRDSLSMLLAWMLTPVPLPTEAPSPTAAPILIRAEVPPTATTEPSAPPRRSTPTPQSTAVSTSAAAEPERIEYPPPTLVGPPEGSSVHGPELGLSWAWEGELAADEYFDVRLWRLGTPERSIAWTKDRQYVERLPSQGWHSWTVVVIRGEGGVIAAELSPRPEPVNFTWQPEGRRGQDGASPPTATDRPAPPTPPPEPPTPSPAPPTRVTPLVRPTRVTPESSQGRTFGHRERCA